MDGLRKKKCRNRLFHIQLFERRGNVDELIIFKSPYLHLQLIGRKKNPYA